MQTGNVLEDTFWKFARMEVPMHDTNCIFNFFI